MNHDTTPGDRHYLRTEARLSSVNEALALDMETFLGESDAELRGIIDSLCGGRVDA